MKQAMREMRCNCDGNRLLVLAAPHSARRRAGL